MRFCLEVCARLFISGEPSLCELLLHTQLSHACSTWEAALYKVCIDKDHDSLLSVSMYCRCYVCQLSFCFTYQKQSLNAYTVLWYCSHKFLYVKPIITTP